MTLSVVSASPAALSFGFALKRRPQTYTRYVDYQGFEAIRHEASKLLRIIEKSGATSLRSEFLAAGIQKKLEVVGFSRELQQELQRRLERLDYLPSYDDALPENWRDLSTDDLRAAVAIMKEEGLNLAWVPRPSLLSRLLMADGAASRLVLLGDARPDLLADLLVVFDGIAHDRLSTAAAAGKTSVTLLENGSAEAAQTYAAVALSHVIHEALGWSSFGEIRRQFSIADPINEVGYQTFALYSVGLAVVRAFDRMADAGPGFNRNVSLHKLGSHDEAGALSALMLLAGLLAELDRAFLRVEQKRVRELDAVS